MNIAPTNEAQIPALRKLWQVAFGDTDDFLDDFFSTAYAPERSRCITIDGEVAAVLYWFRCQLPHGLEFKPLAYIYAVATHPDHRGKGLCRTLMEDTAATLKANGYEGIVLVPQKPSLIEMYEKMGFAHCSGVKEVHVMAGQPTRIEKISMDEFALRRMGKCPVGTVLQWNENLQFLSTQATFYSGKNFVAAVTEVDGKLWCPEFLGKPEKAAALTAALKYDEGDFRMPGDERPFAMFRPLTADCPPPAYFGLAFD